MRPVCTVPCVVYVSGGVVTRRFLLVLGLVSALLAATWPGVSFASDTQRVRQRSVFAGDVAMRSRRSTPSVVQDFKHAWDLRRSATERTRSAGLLAGTVPTITSPADGSSASGVVVVSASSQATTVRFT